MRETRNAQPLMHTVQGEIGVGQCEGVRLESGERDDTVHLSERPWNEAEDSRDDAPGQFPDRCLHQKKPTQRLENTTSLGK